MRRDLRGFTLIEVMVAMAILAMGLTIILSSQAGLFATTKRVQAETYAASLMRCKMSEIELELLEDGFPLIEQNDSGECCEDEDNEFTCEWKIQTVELPQPVEFSDDETTDDVEDEAASSASAFGSPLSDAVALSPMDGSGLSGITGMGDLAGALGETSGGGGGGLVGMALSMVYPTLKPMLEASIRKVVVAVTWQEGSKERRFEVTQYVTNPLEGNLNPNAAEGLEDLAKQLGVAVDSSSTGEDPAAGTSETTGESE